MESRRRPHRGDAEFKQSDRPVETEVVHRLQRHVVIRLTAAEASGSLRHVKARLTAVRRRVVIGLAVLLQLVSAFGVSAGAISILAAVDPVHRVAVRTCSGNSLDLVLAHDDGRSQHPAHALPALERIDCGPAAAHGDHVLRCAGTDSGAAPARAPTASNVHANLVSSIPFQAVAMSSAPWTHPLSPTVPSTLASLRLTVLRI